MARLASVYFRADRRPLNEVWVTEAKHGVDVFMEDPAGTGRQLQDMFVPYEGLSHVRYQDGE
jgi:hypothetical protein